MKFLITGAQFANKGAQALLFSMINEIKEYRNDSEIYYLPLDNYMKYDPKKYQFNIVYGYWDAIEYENNPKMRVWLIIRSVLRKIIKRKAAVSLQELKELHKIIRDIDVVIDVSGFQLTSKFSIEKNIQFLNYTEMAKRHDKKIIYMPQSFGPFDYKENCENMSLKIKNTLIKADLIFAREKEGYILLTEKLGLENVKLYPDIVLQSAEINWKNIYYEKPVPQIPKISNGEKVGIVPNTETFRHGNEESILKLYKKIIQKICKDGKKIYIFRHSNDLEVCKKIYSMVSDNPNVFLLENDFNCLEYSEFVKQFEYIIASRYHAIIHAYKQNVPAIILGWAIKYTEAAKLFQQEEYVFDITSSQNLLFPESIFKAIEYMHKKNKEERIKIANHMKKIRKKTCFEECWKLLENE